MRTGLLLASGLSILVLGGTCLPIGNQVENQVIDNGTTLGITISKPSTDQSVAQGDLVPIQWSAGNLSSATATVTILVESREAQGGLETTVLDSFELGGEGDSGTVNWDTLDFEGRYAVIGRIQTASATRAHTAGGLVTVDAPPAFEFTAPAENVSFNPNDGEALTIAWRGYDSSATARIGLDPDTDHDSGNEIFLTEQSLSEEDDDSGDDGGDDRSGGVEDPASETGKQRQTMDSSDDSTSSDDGSTTSGDDGNTTTAGDGDEEETGSETNGGDQGNTDLGNGSFEWDGDDEGGDPVSAGTYNLFARITDNVNELLVVEGLGQITVTEDGSGNTSGDPVVEEPAEDIEFLSSGDPISIEYKVNQEEDVLVDVKIDADDNHTNGNETIILAQELVEGGEDPEPFEWDGEDSGGVAVEAGIYRVFIAVSTGAGTPEIAEAEGLVMRRDVEDQPLLALLTPATVTNVDPGQYVVITWRDDDPEGNAEIRLVVDDDNDPATGNDDQLEIMSDRDAEPDGVQDSFTWQVPNSLDPGTYYVIGYINGGGNASVAPGMIIVNDPANP